MHAVVVRVAISGEPNTAVLREQVVPRVKQQPGFIAGYWTREGGGGLSIVVFDPEEHAQVASQQVASVTPDNVTIESNDVLEVVASA